MKSFFDRVTRLSMRFRLVTLLLVVVVMVLGTVGGSQLKQELLPPIEFPQTFILAQVSGLSSDQVLNVVTKRLEKEISTIPEIVNLSSTSTGAFGAVITAANDFGLNQQKLKGQIQSAIDNVWFPRRSIVAPEGTNPQDFGKARIAEITPELIVYWAQQDSNLAFQLSPDVWRALSDETLNALLAYLANQVVVTDANKSSLERLVEQEIVPQLQTIDQVANVTITGGQALPGEEKLFEATLAQDSNGAKSFLLQLSSDDWKVIQARIPDAGDLNQDAVERFKTETYPTVEGSPDLPSGWQSDRFSSADDILEMKSLTRTVASVLNDFLKTGEVKGALGQTDDLTVEDVQQMLAIDPTLVNAFTAEQLVTLSPDVFAALPTEFVDNLDGFTRDALAAATLAREIAGETTVKPVDLPSAWRIQPPQIITFSLASIPLATFSVFSTTDGAEPTGTTLAPVVESTPEATSEPETVMELPVGPKLPQLFGLIGQQFGATLDTADDLINVQLSGSIAEQFGVSSIRGADLFNQLAQAPNLGSATGGTSGGATTTVNIAEFVPALTECGFGLLDIDLQNPNIAKLVIGCLKPDAFEYLMKNDPTFVSSLSATVFDYLSPDILALEGVSPPLADVWSTLAQQTQFANQSLKTASDLVALGQGKPSSILNQINADVPERFAGYEVRLFDSLSTSTIRYFVSKESDFFKNLDSAVLLKLSQSVLTSIPADVIAGLDSDVAKQVSAIASGETPSAGTVLADRYAPKTDVVPTDSNAPALDAQWGVIASNAPGIDQLVNASDLLRLPASYGTTSQFFDLLFERSGDFAKGLVGSLSLEAFNYIAEKDTNFVSELSIRSLLALKPEILNTLPQAIQDKANSGEVFIPSDQVTRTNGAPSLLITITKDQDANTVEAYYAVKAIVDKVDAENSNVSVAVAFEQSSFVETSIAGVVREGTLGAFFAILIILLFLSGGVWGMRGRQLSGFVVVVLSALFLFVVVASQWSTANGEFGKAWDSADAVFRFIGLGGIVVGILIIVYSGKLPYPAWRSTLVIAVSIPLSIFTALALMKWLPPAMHSALLPLSENSPIFSFLLRLAPKDLTLNIMTLSGLTVAVGRVVDDSIVVLENIFRQIQSGNLTKREAIVTGTRDVSVAIFSATGITVVVFLPLGLTGGLIGEFFLPFGLAVTYALLASFIVAITVIPVLVELFVTSEEAHEEDDDALQRFYVSALRWTLSTGPRRILVIVMAILSAGIGVLLFGSRPQAFFPDFGDPQIAVDLQMPQGTTIIQTNEIALQAEDLIRKTVPAEELKTLRTIVGGGGQSLATLIGGSSVTENQAQITISITTSDKLDDYTLQIRDAVVGVFGKEMATVSKATLTSQGGFGGFELVMSGEDQSQLIAYDACVTKILNTVDGVANVVSNLSQTGLSGSPCPTVVFKATVAGELPKDFGATVMTDIREKLAPEKIILDVNTTDGFALEASAFDASFLEKAEVSIQEVLKTYSVLTDVQRVTQEANETAEAGSDNSASGVFIRINQQPALSFSGEVETEDTINLASKALKALDAEITLPDGVTIGQGYNSQFQQDGFSGIFVAMIIAIGIVILILILVFGSPVYWFAVIFSIMVAPVGAAIALTVTGRTLGISALIGLLMLLGLVVTNAVVLIDRVSSNRHERGMNVYDALVEAGGRRLRPILMTALATIIALMPLALGLSEGAIIAEELGTVVIGGLLSSTLLTLVVVPAVYYLTTPLHNFFIRRDRATGIQSRNE